MKTFKRFFKIGIGAALLAFVLATPAAFAEEMVDYCVDDNGELRSGVDITSHFTKSGAEYVIQKNQIPREVNADFGNTCGGTPEGILTGTYSRGSFYGGFGYGWGSIGNASAYVQVDLGAVRDINQIGFTAITHADAYWRVNSILLSNDVNFGTYTRVCYEQEFNKNGVEEIFEFPKDETKRFRYIRIKTSGFNNSVVLAMKQLSVKGYCEDLFGLWDIPEVDGGGTYTVNLPVAHFNGVKEYSMQIAAYDADNNLTAFSNSRVSAENGFLSGDIYVPSNTVSLRAALLNSAGEVVYEVDPSDAPAGLYTNESVTLSGGSFAEFSESNNTISVSAKGDADDYITLYVLKNVDKTKSEKEYFNQLGEEIGDSMYYTATGRSGEGIKFSVPFNETGIYYFRVVKSGKSGSESVYYRFSMVTDTEKGKFVSKVFATDGSDWNEITAKYVDELELLTDGNIFSVAEIKEDGYVYMLVKTRDIMFEQEGEKTLSDVNTLVNAAIILKRMENGSYDLAEADINRCPELLSLIGEYASFDRFETVLKKLLKDTLTSEELLKTLQHSAMLSYIQGGTPQDIADMLEKHGSSFGVDIADCGKNGVELTRVAARIDTSDASVYYGDGLKTAFEAAIKAEKSYQADTETTKKPSSSSGGGSIYAPVKKPSTTEPVNPTVPTNPIGGDEIKVKFSDIDGYDWAKESINRLSDKGVLDGYTDGTFKPAAGVLRAEFVKMLVTGLEITVNEKKGMRFADCTGNDWFYPYVAIAYSVGCVSGVDEYTFGVSDSITRQDLAVMLYNAIEHKGKALAMTEEVCSEPLPDYAKEAFNALIEKGIITGYDDGTYKPAGHVTRAEAAVILCRVTDFIEGGAE